MPQALWTAHRLAPPPLPSPPPLTCATAERVSMRVGSCTCSLSGGCATRPGGCAGSPSISTTPLLQQRTLTCRGGRGGRAARAALAAGHQVPQIVHTISNHRDAGSQQDRAIVHNCKSGSHAPLPPAWAPACSNPPTLQPPPTPHLVGGEAGHQRKHFIARVRLHCAVGPEVVPVGAQQGWEALSSRGAALATRTAAERYPAGRAANLHLFPAAHPCHNAATAQ